MLQEVSYDPDSHCNEVSGPRNSDIMVININGLFHIGLGIRAGDYFLFVSLAGSPSG